MFSIIIFTKKTRSRYSFMLSYQLCLLNCIYTNAFIYLGILKYSRPNNFPIQCDLKKNGYPHILQIFFLQILNLLCQLNCTQKITLKYLIKNYVDPIAFRPSVILITEFHFTKKHERIYNIHPSPNSSFAIKNICCNVYL